MIIVIEGNKGTGKTTISRKLEKLPKSNIVYINTFAHPNFLPSLRAYLISNLKNHLLVQYLYYLTLCQITSNKIKDLNSPKTIFVLDRYIYSTICIHLALDQIYNRGKNRNIIKNLADLSQQSIAKPDLVIFLDVEEKKRLKRLKLRNKKILNINFNSKYNKILMHEYAFVLKRIQKNGIKVIKVNGAQNINKTLQAIALIVKKDGKI
ncbi:MAG: deoxynucleoside kinase [Candidatus Micrarchaeota archaeon]|nr:deoxynucleoside kinase [Candidatus Micrarchaeota archaeon]